MSVTSSAQPLMVENSWLTPLMRTDEIAAPSIELSSTLRSELPIVRAYPTSNGSATNLVYVSVLVDSSSWTFLGISNGLKRIAISLSPC